MLTTFVPLVVGWAVVAPFLGVFDLEKAGDFRQLWRPFWAMILAGPLAAWLRGIMLNRPILPVFVVVLGGVSAVALLAWHSLYAGFISRKR